ncbi:Major Facilitator Superfamily protein [compost metagenome]
MIAIPNHSLLLLFVSAVLAGGGHGPAFAGSMAMVNEIAPANCRADVTSSFYALTYLGSGLPLLVLGFVAERIGQYQSILVYSVLIVLAAIVMVRIIKQYFQKRVEASKVESIKIASALQEQHREDNGLKGRIEAYSPKYLSDYKTNDIKDVTRKKEEKGLSNNV